MTWWWLSLLLIPAAWWGRFWLALALARALRWAVHGRQVLPVRRMVRRLSRYAAR